MQVIRQCLFEKNSRLSIHRVTHRGLTIIEVLFSIGIITIGLLGIAILIPLAGKAAKDGANADRGRQTAENGYAELLGRGYLQPASWCVADSTYTQRILINLTNTSIYPNPPAALTSQLHPLNTQQISTTQAAICIDPLFVANNGATTLALPSTTLDSQMFPYYLIPSLPAGSPPIARPEPRLLRVSVTNGYSPNIMGLVQASLNFVSDDDVVFTLPDDKTLLPSQVYSTVTASGVDYSVKRQSEGFVSWLATLVPPPDASPTNRLYTLSIISFLSRSLAMDGVTERMADVPYQGVGGATCNAFFGGGINGGDIALVQRTGGLSADLDVRTGSWLMLARNTANRVGMFQWYRVLATDTDIGTSSELLGTTPGNNTAAGGGFAIRHVRLSGPDWIPDPAYPTQAFLFNDVLNVVQKTVEVEVSSLWTY